MARFAGPFDVELLAGLVAFVVRFGGPLLASVKAQLTLLRGELALGYGRSYRVASFLLLWRVSFGPRAGLFGLFPGLFFALNEGVFWGLIVVCEA